MRDRETEQGLPGSKVPLCPHFFSFLINLFLAVLGLRCCAQSNKVCLVVASRGYSLVVVCRLLTVVAFLVVEHGL